MIVKERERERRERARERERKNKRTGQKRHRVQGKNYLIKLN